MKQIKCKSCGKIWYLDNGEENYLKVCPFCESAVKEKQKIESTKNLGEAIYYALSERGIDMLSSVGKISGFLYDMVPELKKEIKIFTKTFDEEYLTLYRDAFAQDLKSVEITMNKLRRIFIDEEGLSEIWADMLCENCYQAVMYYQGEGLPEIMLAEISDWEIEIQEPQIIYKDRVVEVSPTLPDSITIDNVSANKPANSNIGYQDEEYKNGLDCEMRGDYENALYWYGQSNYSQSYVKAAKLIDAKGNYKRAWRWIIKAADRGEGEGLYMQGLYFQTGRHVKKNLGSAVTYYKKAIEKGNTDAIVALGKCYRDGVGVKTDLTEAAKLFKTGAEAGNAEGQLLYAMCLKQGNGIQKDIIEAATWFKRAVESGNRDAKGYLEMCISEMPMLQRLKWKTSN